MERSGIDYVFAIGLIFVAVIAVAELQFASFFLGQNQLSQAQIWVQLIFVFKGTLVPMFFLAAIWLTAMIFPHVKIHLVRRRYLKEFCWALLGNVLALEIILFNFLCANTWMDFFSVSRRILEFIPPFFLTLLATWQYRRIDSAKNQSAIKFGLITVIENGLIFFISYFSILMILASSTYGLV